MMTKRRKNRVVSYFWYCTSSLKRVSWFFPSVKAARKWKDSQTYKYNDTPVLELYLKGKVSGLGRQKEAAIWNTHREREQNWELRMARIYEEEVPYGKGE